METKGQMMDNRDLVLCLTPVYNDWESLHVLVDEIRAAFSQSANKKFKILVIDDGSTEQNKHLFDKKEVNGFNSQNDVIVSPWAWPVRYYFNRSQDTLVEKTQDEYVSVMINGGSSLTSFWFLDAHFSPYKASASTQKFLEENFYMVDKIEYFDIWARHCLYKNNNKIKPLALDGFSPNYHAGGQVLKLISNTTISRPIQLKKGTYRIAVEAKSIPNPPINNENAHVEISINEKRIGGFFANSEEFSLKLFDVNVEEDTQTAISLTFGNDFFDDYSDRDVLIKSISLEKISND